ncbi:MAG: electron transfer flavoprotein subunit alpha/FixB family protein [Desulfobacteraceae bacterium]
MTRENATPHEHHGVWVFIEQRDGRPARVSLELLCKGRVLADQLGVDVTTISIGQDVSKQAAELIGYGADQVILADSPVAKDYRTEVYTRIIAEQVSEKRPEILLVGATSIGRDLAPRVAARLKTGCTSDCTGLEIDQGARMMLATKPFLGRNVMADIICPEQRPQMVTVRPGIMEIRRPDETRKGNLIHANINISEEDVEVKVVDTLRSGADRVDLEGAEKIVAVGAGVDDEAGFEMLKELADLLAAELGATNLPVDAGWVSEERKIGQTGKTVRPRMYIACGISGAVQHTVGMMNSELIVAINKDPKAEIFDLANYGIVDDLYKVVPALILELKSLKT